MPNMSYCRFLNTSDDLHDCYMHMDDELSDEESAARIRLIKKCVYIALEYGDEIGLPVIEDPNC